MALTDIACRNAKPQPKAYKLFDGAGSGLYLHVLPSGVKTWRLKFRADGEKVVTLGRYPALKLTAARDKARLARQQITEAAEAPPAPPAPVAVSFRQLAEDWYENYRVGVKPITAERTWGRVQRDLLPHIGDTPITDIQPPDVLKALRAIEQRGAVYSAKRVKQYASDIFRFGVAEGRLTSDPTRDIGDALKPNPRQRNRARVGSKGLGRLLLDILSYDTARVGGDKVTRCALHFTMLTVVRTNELRFARVHEIVDLDGARPQWQIPKERMKLPRDHVVPLSRQAVAVLREMGIEDAEPDRLLFPNLDGNPLSENTMLYALYRLGYHSRQTVHGFRGLFSTILNEQLDALGDRIWESDWIELQLAHVESNKVRAAYNAAEWIEPRTRMMQAWADMLDDMMLEASIG